MIGRETTSRVPAQTSKCRLLAVAVFFCARLCSAPIESPSNDQLEWKFEYDDANRITKVIDPARREMTIHHSLDAAKRLRNIERKYADGTSVRQEFNEDEQVVRMADAMGVVTYGWDDFGRLNRVQRDAEPAIAYTYDALDRITSLQVGGFYRIEYIYDFLGRLASMKTPVGIIEYEYLTGQGKMVRKLPNGVRTIWSWDGNGELRQIMHGSSRNSNDNDLEVLAEYTYQQRADGLIDAIQERSEMGQFLKTYKYDSVGRLVASATSGGQRYSYEYDLVGNRLKSVSAEPASQICRFDWAGRLSTVDGIACTHDQAGNLLTRTLHGATLNYRFNQIGEVVEASDKVRYTYDGNGLLIARNAGPMETRFAPNPLAPNWQPLVMESKDAGRVLIVWEGSIPLIVIRAGKAEYMLHDHTGSVRLLANDEGKVTSRLDYEPFGVVATSDRKDEFAPRFAGLFWDADAQVYLTLARAYSPDLGRFLQVDPQLRVPMPSQTDLSLYTYCGGDPVNFRDMDGAKPQSLGEVWRDTYWDEISHHLLDPVRAKPAWSAAGEFAGGQFLNFLGKGSNWIGANRGGGRLSWDKDALNRFPLGDTTVGARQGRWDEAAKWHDVIDYVNVHAEKGTEVKVPWGNDEYKYFISRGRESVEHNIEVFKLAAGLQKEFPMSDVPKTAHPTDLSSLQDKFPTVGKSKALSPSNVGGVYLGGASRALEGIGLLDGVCIDANQNLILIEKSGSGIKLPALRVDDVVTVFRSVYMYGEGPTVTIDPDPANPEKSAMIIRHSEATDGTYVGWVLYQADRLMKGYNLGKDNLSRVAINSNVPGYTKVLDEIYFGGGQSGNAQQGGAWERFWIVPVEGRRFSPPQSKLTLFDLPLMVRTQPMKWENGKLVEDSTRIPSSGAKAFTEWFTANYDAISQEQFLIPPEESGITRPVPVLTELRRIALLTAIAEKLRDEGIPFPFWMRNYQVRAVTFERTTPALAITRSNSQVTTGIFGGVTVSPESVKSFDQPSRLAELPPAQQAAGRERWDRSVSLSGLVREEAWAMMPLEVKSFKDQGDTHKVFTVPGTATRALAPCRLDEVDLEVPIEGGGAIQVVRSFNSFFDSTGSWGKVWAWDLPRLDEVRVPETRGSDGRATYRIVPELTSPLNTVHARFSRIALVPQLNNSRVLIPDDPALFLGLAEGKSDFLTAPTQQLSHRNGEVWHFSKAGDLVATDKSGIRTVYERNADGTIKRIVGLRGRRLVASIELTYDTVGRLKSATGQPMANRRSGEKDVTTVYYEYDGAGKLTALTTSRGRTGYRYDGDRVVAITHREAETSGVTKPIQTISRFEYNSHGQLLAEIDLNGTRTEYRVTTNAGGSTIASLQPGNPAGAEMFHYDRSFRPVEAKQKDGTTVKWNYPVDGGSLMTLTRSDGTTIRFSETADQRLRTVEFDQKRKITAQYDSADRLTSLAQNGHVTLRQEWQPDGKLRMWNNEACAFHLEYDQDGLVSRYIMAPPSEQGQFNHFQQTLLDSGGRPREITDDRGLHVSAEYEITGELKALVTQRDGKNFGFQISRDDSLRVRDIESSWGKAHYSYDAAGLIEKVKVETPRGTSSAEWKKGVLQSISKFDGGEYSLTYNLTGKQAELPKQIIAPNHLILAYQYDSANRPSRVNIGEISSLLLEYDNRGRLSSWRYVAP